MGLRRRGGQPRSGYYAPSNEDDGTMAMEEEEIRPRLAPMVLDRMGIAELEHYIAELRAEIARAETQIAAKLDHRSAADSLFKF